MKSSKPAISCVWTFASDSNPDNEYETLQYADGSTSCNCPGWTRRVTGDGSRSCKHTRLVDQGMADDRCLASHQYDNSKTTTTNANCQTKTSKTPGLGERKFAL